MLKFVDIPPSLKTNLQSHQSRHENIHMSENLNIHQFTEQSNVVLCKSFEARCASAFRCRTFDQPNHSRLRPAKLNFRVACLVGAVLSENLDCCQVLGMTITCAHFHYYTAMGWLRVNKLLRGTEIPELWCLLRFPGHVPTGRNWKSFGFQICAKWGAKAPLNNVGQPILGSLLPYLEAELRWMELLSEKEGEINGSCRNSWYFSRSFGDQKDPSFFALWRCKGKMYSSQ